MPERVHGEERGVEDGDACAIHRIRGEGIVARHAQLADQQQDDAGGQSERRAHGRTEPAVFHRIAEEEERCENERDAGNPRE